MVSAKGITTTIMKTYIGRSVVSTGDIPGISYFSPYRRPVLSSTIQYVQYSINLPLKTPSRRPS